MDTKKLCHENFTIISASRALVKAFEKFCIEHGETGFPYSDEYGPGSRGACVDGDSDNVFDELCACICESSKTEKEEYLIFHEKEEISDEGVFGDESRIIFVRGAQGSEIEATSEPLIQGMFRLKTNRASRSEFFSHLWERNHHHIPYAMFLLVYDWAPYGEDVVKSVKEEVMSTDLSFLPDQLQRVVKLFDRLAFSPVRIAEAIDATRKITFYLDNAHSRKTALELFLTMLTYGISVESVYRMLLASSEVVLLSDIKALYADSMKIGEGIFPIRGTHDFDLLVRYTSDKIHPGGAPTKYEHSDTAWIDLVGKVRTAFYKCEKGQ